MNPITIQQPPPLVPTANQEARIKWICANLPLLFVNQASIAAGIDAGNSMISEILTRAKGQD